LLQIPNVPKSGTNSNLLLLLKGFYVYTVSKDNAFTFNKYNQPLKKAKGVKQFKKNTCSSIMLDLIQKSNVKNVRFSTFTAPEGTPDNVFLSAKELFIESLQELKLLKLWCFSIEWQKNKTIHTHAILDLASQAEFKRITKQKSYVFLNELWSKKLKFQLNKHNKQAKEEDKVKYEKKAIFHCKHLTLGKGDIFINEFGKVETKDGKKVSLESFIDDMVKYISKYMQKNASKGIDFTRKLFRYSSGLKINKCYISSKELDSLDLVNDYSYVDKTTREIFEKRRLKYSTKNIEILKNISILKATRNTLSKLRAKKRVKQIPSVNEADTIQIPSVNEAPNKAKQINLFDAPT
jgi:hypothetical protein